MLHRTVKIEKKQGSTPAFCKIKPTQDPFWRFHLQRVGVSDKEEMKITDCNLAISIISG